MSLWLLKSPSGFIKTFVIPQLFSRGGEEGG